MDEAIAVAVAADIMWIMMCEPSDSAVGAIAHPMAAKCGRSALLLLMMQQCPIDGRCAAVDGHRWRHRRCGRA